MRIKPPLWEEERGSLPTQLYVTVIKLSNPRVLDQDAAPLALLTRSQLPAFPYFPI
jgi:endoribonuclease Dicer